MAEKAAFSTVGLHLSTTQCCETTGLRLDAVIEHWYSRQPWHEHTHTTKAAIADLIIHNMVHELRTKGLTLAKPGLFECLAYVQRKGYRLALATSSPHTLMHAALAALGLHGTFEVTCSAQGLAYGKPHPEVYLMAAAQLGVDPVCCVAVEDSVAGVVAAKAARMRCIAVPEHRPWSDKFMVADVVLDSLLGIDDVVMDKLIA